MILHQNNIKTITPTETIHMTKQTKPKRNQLNKPHNQIAKCIRSESITGLLWAYIQLSQHEIKTKGKTETFSGSDLSKFVSLLHQREIETVLKQPTETDIASVVSWLETTKQDDTETPKPG